MKIYIKRFSVVLVIFSLMIVCVFPVGAWDLESEPIIDYTGQTGLRVKGELNNVLSYINYQPGEWPEVFNFSPYKAGTYTFFNVQDIPIAAGHGVFFLWFVPKACLENATITVNALGLGINTTFVFGEDGFTITNGSGGAVLESVTAELGAVIGDYAVLGINGVLLKDNPSCSLTLTLPAGFDNIVLEEFSFDYSWLTEYGYQASPCIIYGSEDILGDAGNDGEDAPNGILSVIGQSFQGVIGWVGHVAPLITEYPGFIMMIAVSLFVGILTWVSTIYKRRRG